MANSHNEIQAKYFLDACGLMMTLPHYPESIFLFHVKDIRINGRILIREPLPLSLSLSILLDVGMYHFLNSQWQRSCFTYIECLVKWCPVAFKHPFYEIIGYII